MLLQRGFDLIYVWDSSEVEYYVNSGYEVVENANI